MREKVILGAILIAVASLIIGLIGKIIGGHIIFANSTWHMFAQTVLLFAVAWGVGRLVSEKIRE